MTTFIAYRDNWAQASLDFCVFVRLPADYQAIAAYRNHGGPWTQLSQARSVIFELSWTWWSIILDEHAWFVNACEVLIALLVTTTSEWAQWFDLSWFAWIRWKSGQSISTFSVSKPDLSRKMKKLRQREFWDDSFWIDKGWRFQLWMLLTWLGKFLMIVNNSPIFPSQEVRQKPPWWQRSLDSRRSLGATPG